MIHFEFDESIICPEDPTATSERICEYKEYYAVKHMICKLCQPKVIAEIGVRAGYSAWAFLQACPDAKYIGIDANNGKHGGKGGESGLFKEWALKILKGYNVEYYELDTQELNKLPLNDDIDFYHIDGCHTFQGVRHDLELVKNHIGVDNKDRHYKHILIDDYKYLDEVAKSVDIFVEEYGLYATYFESFRGELLITI